MNTQPLVVASIAGSNYLPRVRVLAASLRKYHPELQLKVLLSDQLDALDPEAEVFHLTTLNQLPELSPQQLCFRYDLRQRSSSLKPFFLEYLLNQQHSAVLFLDPDMLVTAPLTSLIEPLQKNPIILTPHLLTPPENSRGIERELEILQAGIFNGGVVGVSESTEARRFLSWWKQRLFLHTYDSVAEGMYYDQRWLDFTPSFFPMLHIVRDTGCNVAHWNLNERSLSWHGELIQVDGKPCSLIHFSGYIPEQADRLSHHREWVTPEADSAVRKVMDHYGRLLNHAVQAKPVTCQPSHDQLANGLPIVPVLRKLFASLNAEQWHPDPFSCSQQSFFHWLMQPADCYQPVILRLWLELHKLLPELSIRWPDALGTDRDSYKEWISAEGWRVYGLSAYQQHLPSEAL